MSNRKEGTNSKIIERALSTFIYASFHYVATSTLTVFGALIFTSHILFDALVHPVQENHPLEVAVKRTNPLKLPVQLISGPLTYEQGLGVSKPASATTFPV